MIQRAVRVRNRLGIHARAAAAIVQRASRFQAEVAIERNGARVNGKSILGIMMLAAAAGTEIVIAAQGPDEREAVTALVDLVEDRFGEPE
ncbi:MAG: HPr family phosphocarrier protein [Nitrospirota bacterium]